MIGKLDAMRPKCNGSAAVASDDSQSSGNVWGVCSKEVQVTESCTGVQGCQPMPTYDKLQTCGRVACWRRHLCTSELDYQPAGQHESHHHFGRPAECTTYGCDVPCLSGDDEMPVGLGGAAKWKSNMLEKASALFSSRGADLQSYIYSTSALADMQKAKQVLSAFLCPTPHH